jgi:methylmalonyl-CoA mutase C-terminal domain/subunit
MTLNIDSSACRRQGFRISVTPEELALGRGEVEKKIRILVAKPGLDGHDRGAKVVAQALRDAGMEVIYTGLHQTIDQIIHTAIQEDVNVIGLSIMSGAHLPICEKLTKKMREKKIEDILLVVGGVIPKRDIPSLQKMGIEGIFPGGTPFDESIRWIKEHIKSR